MLEEAPNIVSIDFLDVSTIKPDRTIILVGKRGTGKSVLMKDLAYKLRHNFDFGVACAPNKDTVDVFEQFVPKSYIYPDFTGEMVETMIENIKALQEHGHRPRIFILLDDCMKDKKVFKHPAIAELSNNGRHYDLFLMICVQYVMDVPPNFRMNADYIFALADTEMGTKEKLFREFFGIFGDKANFLQAFDEFTRDRACLFVDRTQGGATLDKCVKWYKAEFNIPKFKLGCRDYWKLDYMFRKQSSKPKLQKLHSLGKRKRDEGDEKKKELEEQIKKKARIDKKTGGYAPVFVRAEPPQQITNTTVVPAETNHNSTLASGTKIETESKLGANVNSVSNSSATTNSRLTIERNENETQTTNRNGSEVSAMDSMIHLALHNEEPPTPVTNNETAPKEIISKEHSHKKTVSEESKDVEESKDFIHAFSNPVKTHSQPTVKKQLVSAKNKRAKKKSKSSTPISPVVQTIQIAQEPILPAYIVNDEDMQSEHTFFTRV